jgi:transcriptional regulator
MNVPASVAIDAALTRQAIALEVMRASAKADQQMANILEQAIQNVPTGSRGSTVNFSA